MNCKDCYHSDVCGFEGCDDDALTFCKDFKDKSRIVELPCKVGDYVYYVTFDFSDNRIPKKARVISFGINENGVFDVELEGEWSTFVLSIDEIFFNIHCVEKYLEESNNEKTTRLR